MSCHHILITGANRGLGLGMTEHFLAAGHGVWTISRHSSDALSALDAQYEGQLHCVAGDVADEESIRRAIDEIRPQTGRLDVLVNNAGVYLERSASPIDQMDFSVYPLTFQVNAIGPLMVVKHALPLLKSGQRKLIVNISSSAGSIAGQAGAANYAYSMAKAALNMGGRILQNALKDEGIKVLAMHPGWFSSEMGSERAPITPSQAARVIVDLLLRPEGVPDAAFVDPDGNALPW